MTLIYLKKAKYLFFLTAALYCGCFALPEAVYAQAGGLSLSVTPTLFEMSASPLQTWDSAIKVINNNPHELTVYATAVNFAPQGETGEGKFIPVLEAATEGATLAEWITISDDPVIIPAEQSIFIPVSVAVPQDAVPGGHFAAILVGTRPLDSGDSFQVRTSQIVTSLFFVKIAGDVTENGIIREFRTTRKFVNTPYAEFEVRFENKGNVHLQPQGQIEITNMWGKERGVIPINHKTHFGNVLPESIRKFEFTWNGEPSFSDIGRYTAQLTLAYGDDSRKFVTRSAHFYVVPVKALLIVIGSLVAFGLFVRWMVRAYVRRMLTLAGVGTQMSVQQQKKSFRREGDIQIRKNISVRAPIKSGVVDLRNRLKRSAALMDRVSVLFEFVIAYRVFFISVIVLLVSCIALWIFFADATVHQRDYEVVIENPDADVVLSSEDILYERATTNEPEKDESQIALDAQNFELVLVNSSDTPGIAALLQARLEQQGYDIADLQSDFGESKKSTVIVYNPEVMEEALALSKKLDNALLSADSTKTDGMPVITIYLGNDYSSE